MTQSDIIRLAREALKEDDGECYYAYAHQIIHWWGKEDEIVKFANLIAAAEREACAALCFQMWNDWMDNESISELNRPDAEDCAHAIRARGRGLGDLNKEAEKNGEEL